MSELPKLKVMIAQPGQVVVHLEDSESCLAELHIDGHVSNGFDGDRIFQKLVVTIMRAGESPTRDPHVEVRLP